MAMTKLPSEVSVKAQACRRIVRALDSFSSNIEEDLTFEKGDLMIVPKVAVGKALMAYHVRTKQRGYISSILIAEELTIEETVIGHGRFAEVRQGLWHGTTKVALKSRIEDNISPKDFLQHVDAMKKCRHENIVQIFDVCPEPENIFIVMELMCNGNLKSFLRNTTQHLELGVLINMIAQVANGMACLARERIVHRNLSARNVLVDKSLNVKVAGFTLARLLDDDSDVWNDNTGTNIPIKWTAPEFFQSCTFTTKSDVWSFAILVMEIVTHGAGPYPGMTNEEVVEKVQQGYRIPRPIRDVPDKHSALWDIQMKCWDAKPENRPTFEFLFEYYDDFRFSFY